MMDQNNQAGTSIEYTEELAFSPRTPSHLRRTNKSERFFETSSDEDSERKTSTSASFTDSSESLPALELTPVETLLHEIIGVKDTVDPRFPYNQFEERLNRFIKKVLQQEVKPTWMTEFYVVRVMLEQEKKWKTDLKLLFDVQESFQQMICEAANSLDAKRPSAKFKGVSVEDLNEKARGLLGISSSAFYCIDINGDFIDGCFLLWIVVNSNNFKELPEEKSPKTLDDMMAFIQKNILEARHAIEITVNDVEQIPFPVHPKLQEVMKIILGLVNESIIRCDAKMPQAGNRNILGAYAGNVLEALKKYSSDAEKFIEDMLIGLEYLEKPANSSTTSSTLKNSMTLYLDQAMKFMISTKPEPTKPKLSDGDRSQLICSYGAQLYSILTIGLLANRREIEKKIEITPADVVAQIATTPKKSAMDGKSSGRARVMSLKEDAKKIEGSVHGNSLVGTSTPRLGSSNAISLEDVVLPEGRAVQVQHTPRGRHLEVREMVVIPKNILGGSVEDDNAQVFLPMIQVYYEALDQIYKLLSVLQKTLETKETKSSPTMVVPAKPGSPVKGLNLSGVRKDKTVLEELIKHLELLRKKMMKFQKTEGIEEPMSRSLDYLGYTEPERPLRKGMEHK